MNTDEKTYLLDQLQSLLEKQIESARKSDFRAVEELARQTGSLINEIVGTKIFEQAQFNKKRRHLAKLHKELVLMIAAEKENVADQLRRVNEGRKTLKTYRKNI